MQKIQLTKGQYTLVNENDFRKLSQYKWCVINSSGKFYAGRNQKIDGKFRTVLMHRVILGAKPGQIVDHRNGDRLDNRRSNLRFCTASESVQNRGKMKNNKSGFKGVHLNRRLNKYEALITKDHKTHYLGVFKTAKSAGQAYARAAKKLHGNFACVSTKSWTNYELCSQLISLDVA